MDLSCLHKACEEVELEKVTDLVASGFNVNSKQDQFKRTPLHCLLTSLSIWNFWDESNRNSDKANKLAIAKLLLSEGANPNAINHTGMTPLHLAVSNTNYEMVELLLKYGAKPWFRNTEGKTSLHMAAQRNSSDILLKFLNTNLSPNIVDYNGRTPLHDAVSYQSETNIAEILIKKGARVNWLDCKSKTPLHVSIKEKKLILGEMLLKNGADPCLPDSDGFTPLHLAVNTCDIDFIKLIIAFKGEVNCYSSNGNTPLHLAVVKGDVKVIETLIKNHADINAKNNKSDTPLHLAFKSPSLQVIAILIDNDPDLTIKNYNGQTPIDLVKSLCLDRSIKHLIIHHALKIKAAQLVTFGNNIDDYITNYDYNFYRSCLNEIATLKQNDLYYILTDSVNNLSSLMKNKQLEDELFSLNYSKNYPLYSGLMKRKIMISFLRKQLFSLGEKHLNSLFNLTRHSLPYLPHECYALILSYLNNRELKILVDFYQ